jgi:hypothetical protein
MYEALKQQICRCKEAVSFFVKKYGRIFSWVKNNKSRKECSGKSFSDYPSSVVDPNPKESESLAGSDSEKKFGFGSSHCCRMKNTWKRKKIMFFYWKNFFSDVRVPEHIWKQLEALFGKVWGQNISLRSESEKNLWIRILIRKKWIRIHKTGT